MTDLAVKSSPPRRVSVGDGWRMVARGLGQLLISAGVVILLFVGYELWFTGFYTQAQQHDLSKAIHGREWGVGRPDISTVSVDKVPLGTGVAVLFIPRLGQHYHFVVVEGTGFSDLQKGPGHYPGTALPGQVGNFAVAGHRTTYLHPFKEIAKLRNGDAIVLETKDYWFTYRIEDIPGTGIPWKEIVDPTAVQVAYAVPDQPDPGKTPTLKLLTFTSCNPEYSARQRYVVHALLVQRTAKPALPAALTTPLNG
jgi:sortase A